MSTVHALAPLALLAGACQPPAQERQHMPVADAARGREIIDRVGCGACHAIPGVRWPQGSIGPPLRNMATQGLIGGRIPNRPDLLAAFVRDAPALLPDTIMPPLPLSQQESRDVAAYLYAVGDR